MKWTFAAALLLLIPAGCERGSHPRMIGSTAPDFTVQDSERTVSLHDFRGKPVILNFWTSWCPPCIEEMPSLVKLQKHLGSQIIVLAVSWDEDEGAYRKFIRDHNIDLLTVRDPEKKTGILYGTTGQPETFIIDAGGKIRLKFVGAHEWTNPEMLSYLDNLLHNPDAKT
jgi:peroxiredoxin